MVTKDIIEYVKKGIAEHKSRDAISQELLSTGWQQEDINEIFFTIGNPNTPYPHPKKENSTEKQENIVVSPDIQEQSFKRSNLIKIIAITQIAYTLTCAAFIYIDPSNPFFRYGTYANISGMAAFFTLFTIKRRHYKIARNILVVLFSLRMLALAYVAYLFLAY